MLSRTCTIAATLLTLWSGAPGSLGQTSLPTQFTLNQLERQPGTILISPGYITIIEFPEAVSEALSGNQTLFKTSPRKGSNLVVLTAAKSTGQTDLLVRAGGKITMFLVKIDAQGKAPRRYTVTGAAGSTSAAANVAKSSTLPEVLATPVRPATPPVAATRPKPAELLAKYEAEQAVLYGANILPDTRASGGRLVQQISKFTSRVSFPAVRVLSSGVYTLRIRYTNGNTSATTQPLSINAVSVPEVQYPPSGGWDRFATVDVQVTLHAGTNAIRFNASRQGAAKLDVLELWGLQTGEAAELPVAPARTQMVLPAPTSDQQVQIPPTKLGSSNLMNNPSFQAKGATQTPSGWATWSPNGDFDFADFTETNLSRDGTLHGSHWARDTAYRVVTYQSKTGLTSGLYTLRAWMRSSGGQASAMMYVKYYGGAERSVSATVNSWTQVTLTDIDVTSGAAEVGFSSDAAAGQYLMFDDVEFFKQ